MYTRQDLKIMQRWSLEHKIRVTQTRIIEWYEHFNGQVYISFSGGKDSTVLLDMARRSYPDITAVFADTGLEFPEIRKFVKTIENTIRITPKKRFDKVIKEYGYPLISKDVSKMIYGARHSKKKKQNYIMRLNGFNTDGTESEFKKRYLKWRFLLDAPFEISNRCCYWIKEKPFIDFEKLNNKKPIIATMAEDSQQREAGWIKTGCNAFAQSKKSREISKPMSFWTEQDVLQYLKLTKIPYCEIYGEIVPADGQLSLFNDEKLITTGEQRTGCMFCMYGCHLDKVNRFQRMKYTHPRQYDYCINELGCGEALAFIGVKYD